MYLYVCVCFSFSHSLCVCARCICVFDFSICISAWFAFLFVCDGFYLILDVESLYIDFCAFPAFWHLDSWMLESSMCYFHGSAFYLYEQCIFIRWMHLCTTDLSDFPLVFTPSKRSISLWIEIIKSRNDVSKGLLWYSCCAWNHGELKFCRILTLVKILIWIWTLKRQITFIVYDIYKINPTKIDNERLATILICYQRKTNWLLLLLFDCLKYHFIVSHLSRCGCLCQSWNATNTWLHRMHAFQRKMIMQCLYSDVLCT